MPDVIKIPNYHFFKSIKRKTNHWAEDFLQTVNFLSTSESSWSLTDKIDYDKIKKYLDKKKTPEYWDDPNTFTKISEPCFGDLLRGIYTYFTTKNKIPKYLFYKLIKYNEYPEEVLFYLNELNKAKLLGDPYFEDGIKEYQLAVIEDPTKYKSSELFFILSNYRIINEHPRALYFINWCIKEKGLTVEKAFATWCVYFGFYSHGWGSSSMVSGNKSNDTKYMLKLSFIIKNFLTLGKGYREIKKILTDKEYLSSSFGCNTTIEKFIDKFTIQKSKLDFLTSDVNSMVLKGNEICILQ